MYRETEKEIAMANSDAFDAQLCTTVEEAQDALNANGWACVDMGAMFEGLGL